MTITRTDLAELAVFAAVARHRSFSKAALELGVSASALSHSLKGLEARLGVRLLNRTTRSVAPTEAGERLLSALRPALSSIGGMLDELSELQEKPSGSVRITTTDPAIDPRIDERMLSDERDLVRMRDGSVVPASRSGTQLLRARLG